MTKRHYLIIALALVALLISAACAIDCQAANLDANRDGLINADDYAYIRGNVSGAAYLSPEVFAACDLNGDGRLTPADFMDYKSAFEVYDNPPLAANQQPKPGNAYPDMSWWLRIDFMGLV